MLGQFRNFWCWNLGVIAIAGALPSTGFAIMQMECYRQAILAFGATEDQATDVCENAPSSAPGQCFRNAVTVKSVSLSDAVDLCKYAVNNEPAECYRTATLINNLSSKNAVKLCKSPQPYYLHTYSN